MTRDMERQLHIKDDHMTGNWSLGSNYHPCSQYRKISIGVMADSSATMKGKNGKVAVAAELRNAENVTSTTEVPADCIQIGKEVMSPDLGRQNNIPCQNFSPLVHTATSYQNISYADVTGHPEKVSSVLSTSNVLLQPSSSKIAGAMEPDPVFANQMVNPHARDANEQRTKKNACKREVGNRGLIGREEESSYATAQKVLVPEKGTTEQVSSERGNSGNITLRMKVQELLGTVFSPSNKQYSSETLEMDANNLKPMSKTIISESLVAMQRQHVDTKESDIASLNDKISRPVTRSLTHNRPQAQKSAPKTQAPFCQYKKAHLDKNEFSFVETRSRRSSTDVTHGSTMCKRKEREICGTRPVKKSLVEGVHKDESQQVTDGRKIKAAAAANVSLFANKTGDNEIVKLNTEMKQKTCHQIEVMIKRHQPGGYGTMLYKNVDQDSIAKQSLANNVDPEYDLKSPTFELKTTAVISSSRSLFQINHKDIEGDSLSERGFQTKETCSSHGIGFSKGGQSNANTKNFGLGPPILKPAMLIIGGCKENKRSGSPSKEVQSESSADGSPATVPIILENCHERRPLSPCQEEDSESSEDVSHIKGDGDCDKFHDISEQDGLVGAVKLFTLALERVERKIYSTTSRQSSEILLSVSKNIHSQLQNAESKIQNEVGKLTNLGKSKRMRTENQCQGPNTEQQELLKCIYKKFKEEVNQHLANCQSTLEGLEAQEIEVRVMMEKQRLSHRKLLMQTEEAIETQLNDAQRRVADIHRLAREKMLKLKNGISECFKEGLLN